MGSKIGQGIQTGVLSASSVCAIFEIARAILFSPANLVSPAFYGASVVLAWSGKKAVKELSKHQGVVHRAVIREEEEHKNITNLKEWSKKTDVFLQKSQIGVRKLQLEQESLVTGLADYVQGVRLLKEQLKDSQARILKMDKILDQMQSKILDLQKENLELKNARSMQLFSVNNFLPVRA
jgi:hypothetical protein